MPIAAFTHRSWKQERISLKLFTVS
jgi:hypothetical protein